MPEYLAPGVYIEETSYRAKSIEGVSTSTAGFIGPTRFGPTRGVPEVCTSVSDFERIYGGLDPLDYMTNYMAHAVRAFFNEGGARLYISRTFLAKSDADAGIAKLDMGDATAADSILNLKARYPGSMGNMRITFTLRAGLNVLGVDKSTGVDRKVLRGVNNYDMVWVTDVPSTTPPAPKKEGDPTPTAPALADVAGKIYWVESCLDGQSMSYRLRQDAANGDASKAIMLSTLDPTKVEVHVLTVNVAAAYLTGSGKVSSEQYWTGLSFHPSHASALSTVFAADPPSRSTELYVPLVVAAPKNHYNAFTQTFMNQATASSKKVFEILAAKGPSVGDVGVSFQVMLSGGNDGQRPTANEYDGDEGSTSGGKKSGLHTFEDVEDISIIAAPGSTTGYATTYKDNASLITRLLIAHCEKNRYRVAILDSPDNQIVSEIRAFRAQLDSTYAALYYPWIRVLDPITQTPINLPPSGFVAGIWARNDVENGVHKAPANEIVRTGLGLQLMLNKGQQDVLNPEGVNCFRFFEGRGLRLWGARTITSDSEWKYVNLRRYFAYLEHSLDKGTQWVVFQNNGPALWDKVRATVEDFLFAEWKSEHLLGATPAEAYFVKCDRSTMTQNDLDNGRLICQVGVSPLRPAEFVIFRIGQWTASK